MEIKKIYDNIKYTVLNKLKKYNIKNKKNLLYKNKFVRFVSNIIRNIVLKGVV